MTLKILFSNINQGVIYTGKSPEGKKQLSKPDTVAHLNQLKQAVPVADIVCLAEALFESENGESRMVEDFAKAYGLSYQTVKVNGTCWYDLGNLSNQFYGLASLGKWPLEHQEYIFIEEPEFTKNHRDFSEERVTHGSGKLFHDKYIQKASFETSGVRYKLLNLHSVPFHKFGTDPYGESQLAKVREWWKKFEQVLINAIGKPENCIITGDFNNSRLALDEVLPELLGEMGFKTFTLDESQHINNMPARNLKSGEKPYTAQTQMDFILVSPDLSFQETRSVITPSDHPALYAEIT